MLTGVPECIGRYPYDTTQQSNTLELIHDAFQPLSYWTDFMPPSSFQGVAIDTHIYQVFSDAENARSQQDHINNACANGPGLADFQLWAIVGEWTPAMTDCAKYLNGRGIGSRYDGSYDGETAVGSCQGKTGSISDLDSSYKTFLRQMYEAQVRIYLVQLQSSHSVLTSRIDKHVRAGPRMDHVDMEGGECEIHQFAFARIVLTSLGRGLDLPGRSERRLDPAEPYGPPVPQHLRLSRPCLKAYGNESRLLYLKHAFVISIPSRGVRIVFSRFISICTLSSEFTTALSQYRSGAVQ